MILGIAAFLMALLPVLSFENQDYLGYEVMFGKELLNINPFDLGTIASAHLPFSFGALLAFSLPLIAGIIALFSRKLLVVSLVLFITGLVLLIRLPDTIEIIYIIAGNENSTEVDWTMGPGLIGALVLSGLATMFNVFAVLIEKQ